MLANGNIFCVSLTKISTSQIFLSKTKLRNGCYGHPVWPRGALNRIWTLHSLVIFDRDWPISLWSSCSYIYLYNVLFFSCMHISSAALPVVVHLSGHHWQRVSCGSPPPVELNWGQPCISLYSQLSSEPILAWCCIDTSITQTMSSL